MSLANRHERSTFFGGRRRNRISWAALCDSYKIDPDGLDAAQALVCALAFKYVPGFSVQPSQDWGTRYVDTDFIRFLAAVGTVKDHLQSNGKPAGTLAVVQLILDRARLRKVMPESADELHEMLVRWGNTERDAPKLVSEKKLRELLYTLTGLLAEPRSGTGRSNLELQLAFSTLPRLQRPDKKRLAESHALRPT